MDIILKVKYADLVEYDLEEMRGQDGRSCLQKYE